MKSKPFGCFRRQFEPVCTGGPIENSVLILEPVENRESDSSILRDPFDFIGQKRKDPLGLTSGSGAVWSRCGDRLDGGGGN